MPIMRYFMPVLLVALLASSLWFFVLKQASSDGIWRGHFDIDGRGQYDFTALLLDERLIAFSNKARVSYQGSFTVDDGIYRSTMQMYLPDGRAFDSVNLEGQFAVPEIAAEYLTTAGKQRGALTLTRDAKAFRQGASFARIAGQWILTQGPHTTTLSIDSKGALRGANSNGCTYDGTVRFSNPEYNAYHFAMRIASCRLQNGQFEGMGFISSAVGESDILHIQIANQDWGLYLALTRDEDKKELSLHR